MTTPHWAAEPGRGLFSISVAAELTGLHPQTLRIYENEGLLFPTRSSGGTRRYSTGDIDRLHEIMALTSDGLNLAGVRRVLELQEETRRLQAEVQRLSALAPGGHGRVAGRPAARGAGSTDGGHPQAAGAARGAVQPERPGED